jgi:uncharacterized protein (TIGR00251 family)
MKFLKTEQRSGMNGVSLEIRVQPNSLKNQIVGLHADRLKIKIQSPPVDGKANACVVDFLSELFGIAKSRVSLLRGDTSREKTLFLEGLSEEDAKVVLQKHCPGLKIATA